MEKYIRESDAVQTVMEKPDMTPDEKAGIIRRLKAIPAVDVVEVRHGRWLPTSDANKKRCSRCDVIHLIAQYPHGEINYCPNCGAWNNRQKGDAKMTDRYVLKPQSDYEGLKRKYVVLKSDTGECVENCFVLRPDKDPAAKAALMAYAAATKNEILAEDIMSWLSSMYGG